MFAAVQKPKPFPPDSALAATKERAARARVAVQRADPSLSCAGAPCGNGCEAPQEQGFRCVGRAN
jgi:hypothetical protein